MINYIRIHQFSAEYLMKHKGADKTRKKIDKLTDKEKLQFWKKMTALLKKQKIQIVE